MLPQNVPPTRRVVIPVGSNSKSRKRIIPWRRHAIVVRESIAMQWNEKEQRWVYWKRMGWLFACTPGKRKDQRRPVSLVGPGPSYVFVAAATRLVLTTQRTRRVPSHWLLLIQSECGMNVECLPNERTRPIHTTNTTTNKNKDPPQKKRINYI